MGPDHADVRHCHVQCLPAANSRPNSIQARNSLTHIQIKHTTSVLSTLAYLYLNVVPVGTREFLYIHQTPKSTPKRSNVHAECSSEVSQGLTSGVAELIASDIGFISSAARSVHCRWHILATTITPTSYIRCLPAGFSTSTNLQVWSESSHDSKIIQH